MEKFRLLKANEIDVRVGSVIVSDKYKGVTLLLYKDARVDQNILDEAVGPMNWQRSHQMIGDRLYCTVTIWDEDKKQWISKQDVGTESNNEKEKGAASDSFKRACFNVGIGRELYTAPFICISADYLKNKKKKNKKCKDNFCVTEITYNDDRTIQSLKIRNNSARTEFYVDQRGVKPVTTKTPKAPVTPPAEKTEKLKAEEVDTTNSLPFAM